MKNGSLVTLGLIVGTVGVLTGCQRVGRALYGTTFEDSYDRLKKLVDETVDAVASDLEPVPIDQVPPGPCDDLVPGTRTYSDGYALRFRLARDEDAGELLDQLARYWRSRGFTVEVLQPDSRLPAVAATFEDYEFLAEAVPAKLLVEIGGNTPCLPRAEG